MYTSYCIYWHIYLYLNASIYADIYVYRCILACIWSRSTSLLPPGRRLTHDSKGAMQNYQIQVKHWPDITAFSIIAAF